LHRLQLELLAENSNEMSTSFDREHLTTEIRPLNYSTQHAHLPYITHPTTSMRPTPRLLATISSSLPARAPPARRPSPKPAALSLEHFLQRQRVLSLWRTIVRALHKIPLPHRREPLQYARHEFERHKTVSDLAQIRYLVSTGKTEFEGMQRYIDELAVR
jgi:Complex 1 protein (LYR family)